MRQDTTGQCQPCQQCRGCQLWGTRATRTIWSVLQSQNTQVWTTNLVPSLQDLQFIFDHQFYTHQLNEIDISLNSVESSFVKSLNIFRSVWPVSIRGRRGSAFGSWVSPTDGVLPWGSSCSSCRHSCWAGPSCRSCPIYGRASWIWCLQRKVHALLVNFVNAFLIQLWLTHDQMRIIDIASKSGFLKGKSKLLYNLLI